MGATGTQLLTMVETLGETIALPRVRRVFIPEPQIAADKDAEFGLVELDDGAAGLFYAWLGETQTGISRRFRAPDLIGIGAVELAREFAVDDDMARSIGLAAVNAVTQSVFMRTQFSPAAAANSMAGLKLDRSDRLGMIGNFPSLVRAARAQNIPVTVVERKHHMLAKSDGLEITLDPRALSGCTKIICTAATLINDTFDEMLAYCRGAETLAMIGPSASFFPDPLFERGFHIVGGTTVIDAAGAIDSMRSGRGLRDQTRRYTLTPDNYPGSQSLLKAITEPHRSSRPV